MNARRLLIPILLVLAVGFIVMAVLRARGGGGGEPAQQQQAQPVATLPRARVAIEQGQRISEDMLESAGLSQEEFEQVPTDAVQDPQTILGGTALVDIQPGEYFRPTNFQEVAREVSAKIEPGFVGITIGAPEAPTLYDLGFLQPDDRVDLFGILEDEGNDYSVSVRLVSNARLLAVDQVHDQFLEEQRIAKLEREIAELQAAREAATKQTPPPSAETLKATYDDPIAAKQAELEAVPEHPSVTVEVTPDEAQRIALWRETGQFSIALHREVDAETFIFEEGLAALPTGVVATPGAGGAVQVVSTGPLLTIDDVVPLQDRSPQRFFDRQDQQQELVRSTMELETFQLEEQVRRAELREQLENVRRYGLRTPPVTVPDVAVAPVVPAPVVPAPVVPVAPPAQPGVSTQDLQQLRGAVQNLSEKVDKLRQREGAPVQPPSYEHRIEVIRGTERSVVES